MAERAEKMRMRMLNNEQQGQCDDGLRWGEMEDDRMASVKD